MGLLAWACVATGWVSAQQRRAELALGVAGAPVANAWNPLEALVRDAPAATLTFTADAGGLQRGEVNQRASWTFPDAAGVQRLSVDVPLPSWRVASWRIEHGGRVLASGSWGARDRDARPLELVVSARPAAWADTFGDGARVQRVRAADLPQRAAGWDGVASLVMDGTVAPPRVEDVLTAAASGVRVLVPVGTRSGYDALAELVADGPRAVGAGSLEPLADPEAATLPEAPVVNAWTHEARHDVRAAAVAALPGVTWRHPPKPWVAVAAASYAVLVWVFLRIGGRAGVASSVLIVLSASLAVRAVSADGEVRTVTGAVALAADGLAWRSEFRETARLPRGTLRVDGVFAPVEVREVSWREGTTRLSLPAGGRVRLTAPPTLARVPEEVSRSDTEAGAALPVALREALPADVHGVAWNGTWWLWHEERVGDTKDDARAARGRP